MKAGGAIAVSLAMHGLALVAAVQWKAAHPSPDAAGPGTETACSVLLLDVAGDEPPPAPLWSAPDFEPPAPVPPMIVSTQDAAPAAFTVPAPVLKRPPANESARAKGARQSARVGGGGGSAGEAGVFSPPQYRRCPAPPYPMAARAKKLAGVVLLRVAVSESGVVESVVLRHSSGHATLDEAALRAVRGWLFQPAHLGDRAVPAAVEVPVRFALTS